MLGVFRETAQVIDFGVFAGLFQACLDLVLDDADFLAHGGVPVVLDRILGAALENLGDLCPLVAVILLENVENEVFLEAPLGLFDLWVEVVVPSLPALFADLAWQVLGDGAPVACALV